MSEPMSGPAAESLVWFTSSYSSAQGQCAACARLPGGMAVRDSKQANGPVLRFNAASWRVFTEHLKAVTKS
jgi:hypothetical protein